MAKGKYIRTEEHRKMLSANKKGKKLPPFSLEHKNKLSLALRGNKHFLGKKHKDESKLKISLAKKGKKRPQAVVQKMMKTRSERYPDIKPMLGKHHNNETKAKIRLKRLGSTLSVEHRKKIGSSVPNGDKHWNWKGGINTLNDSLRKSLEYKLWREAVFERDNFTCVWCGQEGGSLEADHIQRWSDTPDLRFAIDNGRTLCQICHNKRHSK